MSSRTDIQLISSSDAESSLDTVTCRLCRRQFAKYTCPTCNVPYCSLTCFRSQAHNQCSEGFYKKEIENDIHSGPSKTLKERQQMIELLKNFEDTASNQKSFAQGDSEEDDDDELDLVARFGAVNLESTSPDELWAMLTREERAKFMKAFEDPASELAQQLLSSEQLEKEMQGPWWEGPTPIEDEGRHKPDQRITRHGPPPIMMKIPASEVTTIPFGHPLGYNMCAVCIGYSYITRHLGTSPLSSLKPDSPERHEARRLVSQMVPFLTDRQLYVCSAVEGLTNSPKGKMTSDLFALMLQDAGHLFEPLRVTEVAPATDEAVLSDETVSPSHPHIMPVLVLSDLHDFFSQTSSEGEPSQSNQLRSKDIHVTHKLRFYAVHILSTPTVILETLAREMTTQAERYKEEAEAAKDTRRETKQRSKSKMLVEEI